MKRLFLFCIFLLLLFTVIHPVSYGKTVEMLIAYEDKEQPPYYMGNTSEVLPEKPGVAVEMVKMLEAYLDVKITFVRYPWKRCTTLLGSNAVDGIFNASFVDERWEIGWYPTTDKKYRGPIDTSRRITTISYSLYVMESSALVWDGKEIKPITSVVGIPIGYSIITDLKKTGVSIEESPSTLNNLEKLINKRLDAVALQEVTADSIIGADKSKFGKIRKLSPPISVKPYYLMLSSAFVAKNPELSQKIWDTIKIIRENKSQQLVRKYIE